MADVVSAVHAHTIISVGPIDLDELHIYDTYLTTVMTSTHGKGPNSEFNQMHIIVCSPVVHHIEIDIDIDIDVDYAFDRDNFNLLHGENSHPAPAPHDDPLLEDASKQG